METINHKWIDYWTSAIAEPITLDSITIHWIYVQDLPPNSKISQTIPLSSMPALASMELVTDLTIFIAILVLIDYCLAVADCVSNPFCFNFVILNKKISLNSVLFITLFWKIYMILHKSYSSALFYYFSQQNYLSTLERYLPKCEIPIKLN